MGSDISVLKIRNKKNIQENIYYIKIKASCETVDYSISC